MKIMQPEPSEWQLQRLKEEQRLILNQVDNAIALFDPLHHLVLYNQKLIHLWALSADWLDRHPHFQEFGAQVVIQGYWSLAQSEQLYSTLYNPQNVSFSFEQPNGIHIEVKSNPTPDGGR
ncbi:MAG TPA: PAS-domain containing protein, partial [Coleofasciculaceae cyanobacterium]